MLKAHKEKRNTIYLLGYVKIRVYNIVHNPILSYRREKKIKRKMPMRTRFGQISSFAFISSYRKLMS